MKTSINSIQGTGQFSLIIRHAERHPITNMNNPFEAMLTEKGANDAFLFGQEMSGLNPVRLYHSPVARCRDTAINIGRGIFYKSGQHFQTEGIIDLGGPYIRGDWNWISKLIETIGHDSFMRQWFDGMLPDDIMMPIEEAALNQLAVLAGQLVNDGPSAINVTHDWNIMILREWAFKLKHEDAGWPVFLDGIAARRTGSSICLLYHEHLAEISLDSISLPTQN